MSEQIRLRCLRPLWHAGRAIKPNEVFAVDVPDAQTAIGSGRAECLDDVQRAALKVGAQVERERLLHRLARQP